MAENPDRKAFEGDEVNFTYSRARKQKKVNDETNI
jgi:hypothetical protein